MPITSINTNSAALVALQGLNKINSQLETVTKQVNTGYKVNDALDAYQRAAELDPQNRHIKARLDLLRANQANGMQNALPACLSAHEVMLSRRMILQIAMKKCEVPFNHLWKSENSL